MISRPSATWNDYSARTIVASAAQVARLNRDGFFVMEHALHVDTVDDILQSLADTPPGTGPLDASQSPTLRNLCTHPLLAGLARDFLGADARVQSDLLCIRLPHERETHQFRHDATYGLQSPQQSITCWLALTNATIANGCLAIARGHHRDALPRRADGSAAVDPSAVTDVEVKAGSVVVMSTLTPRRTHTNTSDRPAMAYVIRYVRDQAIVLSDRGSTESAARQFPVVRGGQLVGPS